MQNAPEIVYEDNHLIAVNKTVHDLVQKDKTGDKALDDILRHYIKIKYNKPGNVFLGIPHRLDRPVSGAVIFARTSKALTRMNKLFREGGISKKYWAIVKEQPKQKSGTLENFLIKNERQNKSYCVDQDNSEAKRAELDYKYLCSSDKYHLLEVNLKTGRHHQIRVQLSAMGCPIKGDLKYGFDRSNKDGGISLHARELAFIHPVSGKEVIIVADPPTNDPLWKYFAGAITAGH